MTVKVTRTEDLAACLELRRLVFMEEQGVSEEEEIDGLDPHCLHLLAEEGGRPLGTARVLLKEGVAKIGRVCVLKAHRGRGLGRLLIEAALEQSRGRARTARLGAQVSALGFYEGLGFIAYGPLYDDAGIPHRDMERPL